jgi:hypothetical protein
MGLREMFSPCIPDNFIAEYYDRITSNVIAKQDQPERVRQPVPSLLLLPSRNLTSPCKPETGVFPRDHFLDMDP